MRRTMPVGAVAAMVAMLFLGMTEAPVPASASNTYVKDSAPAWTARLIDSGPIILASFRHATRTVLRRVLELVPDVVSTGSVSSIGLSPVMVTVVPTRVAPNNNLANALGRRTQPCDAGWPGIVPAWSARPSQVSRCMKGMGA